MMLPFELFIPKFLDLAMLLLLSTTKYFIGRCEKFFITAEVLSVEKLSMMIISKFLKFVSQLILKIFQLV